MIDIWSPIVFSVIFLTLLFSTIILLITDKSNVGWIISFAILLILPVSPYLGVRGGYSSNQTLTLDKGMLHVRNSWFIYKHSKIYQLTSLDLEIVEPWNMFTNKTKPIQPELGRIIINKNIIITNFFEVKELREMIDAYKTGANKH